MEYTGYSFLWLIFAIIGLFVGKAKGHGGMGFILGFLLGPVGLIIIILMKSDIHSGTERGEELNVQIIPEDKKKKIVCPYCKLGFFYNSDKQAKCPGCSRVIV